MSREGGVDDLRDIEERECVERVTMIIDRDNGKRERERHSVRVIDRAKRDSVYILPRETLSI